MRDLQPTSRIVEPREGGVAQIAVLIFGVGRGRSLGRPDRSLLLVMMCPGVEVTVSANQPFDSVPMEMMTGLEAEITQAS